MKFNMDMKFNIHVKFNIHKKFKMYHKLSLFNWIGIVVLLLSYMLSVVNLGVVNILQNPLRLLKTTVIAARHDETYFCPDRLQSK